MEALLEKEADVESWNDERMDELSRRVDAGFEKTAEKEETNRRFDEGAAQLRGFESDVRTEFHRFGDRLDKLFYIQLFFLVSLAGTLLTDKA
jgi:hypothetical protein